MGSTQNFKYMALAIVGTFILSQVQSQEDFIISSPQVTDWGNWGEMERCPLGSFVYGYRMKVQEGSGILDDDTALNGIELLCTTPTKRLNATSTKAFTTITSTVGHAGEYHGIMECPEPDFAVGFQLRSEPNQLAYDDSAANGLKLSCSSGIILEGYDNPNFGDYTEEQRCPRSTYICGIQTQVEGEGETDETSLNNVNMVCCDSQPASASKI